MCCGLSLAVGGVSLWWWVLLLSCSLLLVLPGVCAVGAVAGRRRRAAISRRFSRCCTCSSGSACNALWKQAKGRKERKRERVCVHFLLCVYVCAVSESKGENDSGSSEKAFNSLVVFDRSLVVKGGEGEEGDDFDELSTVACNNLVFLEVS